MKKKQMDERRDGRRTIYKFYLLIVASGFCVVGPFEYFARDSSNAFYASIALFVVATTFFLIAEIRDVIQRKVVE